MSEMTSIQAPSLTIGKLADKLGINLETIRFYQREGLIKEPAKRNNGFRYYSDDHLAKITFILKAKELGFTLSEIKEFLQINSQRKASCADVTLKVNQKLSEIDKKIEDLNKIKSGLKKLKSACNISEDEMKKYNLMDCFINDCKC